MLVAIVSDGCLGPCFNLGADRPYSLVEFVETLKKFCDFRAEACPSPPSISSSTSATMYGDYSRFRAATGWQPRVELEEGLERTVAFYRQHKEVYWQ